MRIIGMDFVVAAPVMDKVHKAKCLFKKRECRVYYCMQKIMDILMSLYVSLDCLDCRQELQQGQPIFGLLHSSDPWKWNTYVPFILADV